MRKMALKRGKGVRAFSSKAAEVRYLDDLFREVVFHRDGYACQKCGKRCTSAEPRGDGFYRYPPLQLAHIFSRSIRSMRWTATNALCLCSGCHLWGHHNPTLFSAWFGERWPERERVLRLTRGAVGSHRSKLDLGAIRLSLEALRAS